jgi:hypothetical protein
MFFKTPTLYHSYKTLPKGFFPWWSPRAQTLLIRWYSQQTPTAFSNLLPTMLIVITIITLLCWVRRKHNPTPMASRHKTNRLLLWGTVFILAHVTFFLVPTGLMRTTPHIIRIYLEIITRIILKELRGTKYKKWTTSRENLSEFIRIPKRSWCHSNNQNRILSAPILKSMRLT